MALTEDIDVFLSYSTKNKNVADAIVSDFESNGIKCWYAPRDIMPGEEWVPAITGALEKCKVLVFLYTDESNDSKQVMNEVALAFNAGKTIVPFRLTETEMSSEFEYYLTRVHWLDAINPPLEENISNLRVYVDLILSGVDTSNLSRNAKRRSDKKVKDKPKSKKKVIIPAIIAGVVLVCAFLLIIIAVTVFVIIGVSGSEKACMKKGLKAYYSEFEGSKENETARGYFEKAAKKGNADAYYYLGSLDEREYDYDSARENFEKGVDAGSDLAGLELGYLYENGHGVNPDLQKARELYEDAESNGCIEAYYYEADYLLSGYMGVDADIDTIMEYLEKAQQSEIKEISANSYLDMGYIYESGFMGTEKDTNKALLLYRKAIDVYPYYEGYGNDYIAEMYLGLDETDTANTYYRDAYRFFLNSAENGNIDSMLFLGFYYQNGTGTAADSEMAMDYFRKVSDKGIPNGMVYVAKLYELGIGNVKTDYDKAYEWYKKASDSGYAEAMNYIGNMYYNGKYGETAEGPDYNSARTWYEKALDNGCIKAYTSLGIMYENGFGADKDYQKAYEMFEKSAEYGNSDAMYEIGYLNEQGVFNGEDDFENALSWYHKSATYGNTRAMNTLGLIYEENGKYEEAKEWYLSAAAKQDADGMWNLALLYYDGVLDTGVDYTNAFKWFEKAMDAGDKIAEIMVANMYMDGLGVNQDYAQARLCYEDVVAADEADDIVYYALATIYHDGLGTEKDGEKARDYYEKSADMGSIKACEKLGKMYFEGKEIDCDYSFAYYYLQKAVDYDEASAETYKMIGDIYYYGYTGKLDGALARQHYRIAADMGLNDAEMYHNLGMTYYLDNMPSDGADCFVKEAEINHDPGAMYNAGVCYYNAGDYYQALDWMGKSIDEGYERDYEPRRDIKNMVEAGNVTYEAAAKWLD